MGELHHHHETLRPIRLRSFAEVLRELERLDAARDGFLTPGWDVPHTLVHCTRSITYSMQGFPLLKPPLYRATLGPLAFKVFSALGKMRHNLQEEIPGDSPPPPSPPMTWGEALGKLRTRIIEFDSWQGALQPHFAYGRLSKADYERAHSMHVANHLAAWHYMV